MLSTARKSRKPSKAVAWVMWKWIGYLAKRKLPCVPAITGVILRTATLLSYTNKIASIATHCW